MCNSLTAFLNLLIKGVFLLFFYKFFSCIYIYIYTSWSIRGTRNFTLRQHPSAIRYFFCFLLGSGLGIPLDRLNQQSSQSIRNKINFLFFGFVSIRPGILGGIKSFTVGQHPSWNIWNFFSEKIKIFFRIIFFVFFWLGAGKCTRLLQYSPLLFRKQNIDTISESFTVRLFFIIETVSYCIIIS